MTVPTDRHREIATKIVVKYIDRGANKEIVGYVAAWLATVCAEERAELARLAQSEEMVEKIVNESSIGPNAVRAVIAAAFRETPQSAA